jgi:hypothetical protein
MAAARNSEATMLRYKEVIEQCLREGFRPFGHHDPLSRGSAVEEASRRLDLARGTLGVLIQRGRLTPDWSLYVGPKPRIRVPAGRMEIPGAVTIERGPPVPVPIYDEEEVVRVLVIPDAHDSPDLDKARFDWMGAHAMAGGFDRIVFIGDVADFDSLNSHAGNDTLAGKLKPSFLADVASLNEAMVRFLSPMEGGGPRVDLCLGNHEYRLWRFEDGTPETAGMLQHEFYRVMDTLGVQVHEFGAYLDVGGVLFTHIPINGYGKPMGGMHTSAAVGRQSTQDVVFGHSHRASVANAPKVAGTNVRVFEVGCALPTGYKKPYARHNLGAWDYCVVELTITRQSVVGWNYVPMELLAKRYGSVP